MIGVTGFLDNYLLISNILILFCQLPGNIEYLNVDLPCSLSYRTQSPEDIVTLTKNVVELTEGKIRGHVLYTGDGKEFYAFQEVPYAAPPIGEYRFKEPREPLNWDGILDESKNSKICMQNGDIPENLIISEDCLYLNVYSPVKPGVKEYLLPVIIWIHGGVFLFESGSIEYYNPKYLLDYDVIVVSINYRLGPFGFLATSDAVIPGNLGVKDQMMALKWVHKNIHLFGGDKDRITLMGASAGAMSAGYIQLSRLAKGLVSGFILMSGSPLSPYGFQANPDHFAFKMGKALDSNFNSTDTRDLLKLLQKVPAENLLNAVVEDDIYNHPLAKDVVWTPIIENKDYENALVTSPMLESLLEGDFEQVPMLISTSSEESLGLIRDLDALKLDAIEYDRNVSSAINPDLNIPEEYSTIAGEKYINVYTTSFQDNTGAFIKYLGDEVFSTPSIHHAVVASAYVPVYFSQFSYKGPMGFGNTFNIPGTDSVGHTEDLSYLFSRFGKILDDPKRFPESDQLTMKRMLKLITNFVKFQNPTPDKDELLQGIIWPQIDSSKLQYLNINVSLEIKENPKHYVQVKRIFEKYRRKPYNVF